MIDFSSWICSPSSLVIQTPHSLTMTSLMMPLLRNSLYRQWSENIVCSSCGCPLIPSRRPKKSPASIASGKNSMAGQHRQVSCRCVPMASSFLQRPCGQLRSVRRWRNEVLTCVSPGTLCVVQRVPVRTHEISAIFLQVVQVVLVVHFVLLLRLGVIPKKPS